MTTCLEHCRNLVIRLRSAEYTDKNDADAIDAVCNDAEKWNTRALTAPEAQEREGWRLVSDEREHGRIIIGYAIVDTATGNWNQHLMSWNKYDNKWAGWPEHMAQPTHWQPLPKPPKDGGE